MKGRLHRVHRPGQRPGARTVRAARERHPCGWTARGASHWL